MNLNNPQIVKTSLNINSHKNDYITYSLVGNCGYDILQEMNLPSISIHLTDTSPVGIFMYSAMYISSTSKALAEMNRMSAGSEIPAIGRRMR